MRDAGFPAVFDFSTVSDYISNLMRLPFYLPSAASALGTSSYMPFTCSTAELGAKNNHFRPLTKLHRRELKARELAAEFLKYFRPPSGCAERLNEAPQWSARLPCNHARRIGD